MAKTPLDDIMSGKVLLKRERILKIGIELEGGWENPPKGAGIGRDGSVEIPVPIIVQAVTENPPQFLEIPVGDGRQTRRVRVPGTGEVRKIHPPNWTVGELASDTLKVEGHPGHLTGEVPQWLEKYYPSHVNHTCGMHVHMSFKNPLNYSRLMVPEYQGMVLKYFKRWASKEGLDGNHPIWSRLNGDSRYCQHIFNPDDQIKNTTKDYDQRRPGHRYTAIHYCYGRYKTIECRLLPMFHDWKQAFRAINLLNLVTNGFLVSNAKREPKFKADVQGEDEWTETSIIEIPPYENYGTSKISINV